MKRHKCFCSVWQLAVAACLLSACGQSGSGPREAAGGAPTTPAAVSAADREPAVSPIAAAARSQVGKTLVYDPAYVGLAYPGGDVPIERGVCTDVVIRALRAALQMDLQKLVHEDMKGAFSQYPTIWGLKKPDRNIDHRRVPNLRTYFERSEYSVGVSKKAGDFLPGDLVTCMVGNRPHIMVVSDKKTPDDVPLVVHNIGAGTREENRLFAFTLTGHYRIEHTGSSDKAIDGD